MRTGYQLTAVHSAAQVPLLEKNFHDSGACFSVPSFWKRPVVNSLLLMTNSCTNSVSSGSAQNIAPRSQGDRSFRVFANRDARYTKTSCFFLDSARVSNNQGSIPHQA